MSNIILCVDDSATMQTVAEITFRGSDWEYMGARSAEEARTAASGKSPALILVDAVMPDGSGYDLAKELKANNSGALVLMVCGNSETYDEGKGAAAGCDGHISKPWQTDKLIEQLEGLAKSGPSPVTPATARPNPVTPEPPARRPVATPPPKAPEIAKAPEMASPRSATLMGMPALEMPPSKPLPAGVAAIKPSKPVVPAMAAPAFAPPPSAAPATKPPTHTPAPPMRTPPPPTTPAPKAAAAAPAARAPMIKEKPGKPIRLVLASQAEAAAKSTAQAGGFNGDQAEAFGAVSRELLEQIIWDVVPQLAESIIRENLDTLTAKAR